MQVLIHSQSLLETLSWILTSLMKLSDWSQFNINIFVTLKPLQVTTEQFHPIFPQNDPKMTSSNFPTNGIIQFQTYGQAADTLLLSKDIWNASELLSLHIQILKTKKVLKNSQKPYSYVWFLNSWYRQSHIFFKYPTYDVGLYQNPFSHRYLPNHKIKQNHQHYIRKNGYDTQK